MPKNEFTCDCEAVNVGLVDSLRERLPENELSETASFFKVLGDRTRCNILFALKENELCVCDLAALLSMTKSAVSHQLATLRKRGAVKCRRQGKEVYYSLDDAHVLEIFSVAQRHVQHRKKEAIPK